MLKIDIKNKQANDNDSALIRDYSKINPVYLPLINDKSRYLNLYGGAGSGKSYFAAQKILMRMMKEQGHRFLLVRKVAKTIRSSQFSLLKSLIYEYELGKIFTVRESTLTVNCKTNGNEIVSAGLDDREKLKSIAGITSIWIEEATELDMLDFLQVNLRLRGRTENYKQIMLTYNPVDANHWLNTTKLDGSHKVKTTFRDNTFIDREYIKVLDGLKEQDENYYNIYALGEWGTLRNIIYKPFELADEYPEIFDEIIYGLDFGYNNPTALIEVKIRDDIYYLNELIYEKHLTNSDLIKTIKKLGIPKSRSIYCDSSEPNRIRELINSGYNASPASKEVRDGIDFLKSCRIISRHRNTGINKEVLSYSYRQDANGNVFEEPVKFNDHAMDAIRYAIYTHNKDRKEYRIRFI